MFRIKKLIIEDEDYNNIYVVKDVPASSGLKTALEFLRYKDDSIKLGFWAKLDQELKEYLGITEAKK